MAVMIARTLKVIGQAPAVDNAKADALLAGYKNADKTAKWAKPGLAITISTGIINGRLSKDLAVADDTTRAEAVTIIKRLYDRI